VGASRTGGFRPYEGDLAEKEEAIIAGDVSQAVGLGKVAAYVKELLNMIERPLYDYENVVVLVATSEWVSRGEIGSRGPT